MDDLDIIIYMDPGIHPELAAKLPLVILDEDTLGPVTAMNIETLDPNAISAVSAANIGITHTPGVCDDSGSPIPILVPIKPIPKTHINEEPDDENEYSDGEYSNYDDDTIEVI